MTRGTACAAWSLWNALAAPLGWEFAQGVASATLAHLQNANLQLFLAGGAVEAARCCPRNVLVAPITILDA